MTSFLLFIFHLLKGIGQQLKKQRPNDPDCCYYLHCASYDYPVTPDPINDERNAQDFQEKYLNKEWWSKYWLGI